MIREFQLVDAKQVYDLGNLVNSNFEGLYNLEEVPIDKFTHIYVYLDEEKIVGFIQVTCLYETMDIVNLVVDPDYRRRGIGSLLLDYVISEFDLVKLITLEVRVDNEAAINLYKKFGFKIINVRKKYYKLVDAYLMQRSV